MPQARIGVIGGTGLYDIEGLTDVEEVDINTPFGRPSAVTASKITATIKRVASCPLPERAR